MSKKIITPDAHQNIIARGLPKTNQTTSYAGFDDGVYEAGWWQGKLVANNRTRFISKTIGGDDIVFDRATGLMWAAKHNQAGCNNDVPITWAAALTYCNGLTFAGFSDWRLPNARELDSLVHFELLNPSIYPQFTVSNNYEYWTSTTFFNTTTEAWVVYFGWASRWTRNKTNGDEIVLRAVRLGV